MTHLDTEYVTPTGTLTVADISAKKTHNTMMIDIASSLSYEEFDDVKDCKTAFEMWNKLKDIYGGDDNVRRAKEESLRGQFDQKKKNLMMILKLLKPYLQGGCQKEKVNIKKKFH